MSGHGLATLLWLVFLILSAGGYTRMLGSVVDDEEPTPLEPAAEPQLGYR